MLNEIFQPHLLDIPSLMGAVMGSMLDPFTIATAFVALKIKKGPIWARLLILSIVFASIMCAAMTASYAEAGDLSQWRHFIPRSLAVWAWAGVFIGFGKLLRKKKSSPSNNI